MCETRVYEAACFNKHNHVRCKETTTSVCPYTITVRSLALVIHSEERLALHINTM